MPAPGNDKHPVSNSTTTVRFGFPFFSSLGLLFLTLKLCGVITWSWWWVLLPLYGPVAVAAVIVFVLCVCALACCVLAVLLDDPQPRRWRS